MRDCNQSGGDVSQILDIDSLGAFETGELVLEESDAVVLLRVLLFDTFEF